MLKLTMERGEISAEEGVVASFISVLTRLRESWDPMIEPVHGVQSTALGLNDEPTNWGTPSRNEIYDDSDPLLAGEVFIVESGLVVVTLQRNERGSRIRFVEEKDGLIAGIQEGGDEFRVNVAALVHDDPAKYLDVVRQVIADVLGFKTTPYKFANKRFDRLREEAVVEEIPSGAEYVTASRALLDRESRVMAVAIKSSRGLLGSDAGRQLKETDKADSVIETLIKGGVATSELVIVCTTTGNQVARVEDKEKIKSLAKQGLRCACGKPIDEESPELLLSISAVGTILLDKSRWMSVLVRERLKELGVPEGDILLECQLGADEIDCIALISGEVAIFELKDKEFSIGNAYSFGAKVSIVKPEHGVIVTTDSVAKDVKSHFDRTHAVEPRRYALERSGTNVIHYVEGQAFLDNLDPVVGAIFAKDGTTILDGALRLMPARASSIVDQIQQR
jgi:hypothetical protein